MHQPMNENPAERNSEVVSTINSLLDGIDQIRMDFEAGKLTARSFMMMTERYARRIQFVVKIARRQRMAANFSYESEPPANTEKDSSAA